MNSLNLFLEKKDELNYADIRKVLYKLYIKSVEENNQKQDENMDKYRIILTNTNNNPKTSMNIECNGLILEHDSINNTYKVLNVPIHNSIILYNYLNKKVKNFTEYTIDDIGDDDDCKVYKLYDGTIINLYYYNDSWVFSTSKGYEVNNLYFAQSTYQSVFDYIVQTHYPNFSYDNLDKNKCYSICMKYHKYHVFNIGYYPNKYDSLHLIQSVDLNELNANHKLVLNYEDNIGLDLQEEIGTHNSEIMMDNNYVNTLYVNSKNEYNYYKKAVINNEISLYEPIYGYIIRNNNINKCGIFSSIMIESSLYVNIKNILYKNNRLEHSIENVDMVVYNLIKSFLGYRYKDALYKMFPNYYTLFKTLHELIYDQIPSFIIGNLDNMNLINSSPKKKIKYNSRFIHVINKDMFIDLSINVYSQIKKNNIVLANDNHSKSIIIDFIHDNRFLDNYYNYMIHSSSSNTPL